jgi:hypothetical protein
VEHEGKQEPVGRPVFFPRATISGQSIYSYTLEGTTAGSGGVETTSASPYIIAWVPIRLIVQLSVAAAEGAFADAERKVTGDAILETGQESLIRTELFDWGILVLLRCKALARERQGSPVHSAE